jgi:hypothetical protein
MKSRKKNFAPKPTVVAHAVQQANEEPKKEHHPMKPRRNRWAEAEDIYLRDNAHLGTRAKAGHLNRTMKAVDGRVHKLRKAGYLPPAYQPATEQPAPKVAPEVTKPANARRYRSRCKGQHYAYENKHVRIYSDKPFGWLKRLRYGVKAVSA